MIREICKDETFLAQKAAPATAADLGVAQDIGVGPHAKITSPLTPQALIASITVPCVPMLPSSDAIVRFPYC